MLSMFKVIRLFGSFEWFNGWFAALLFVDFCLAPDLIILMYLLKKKKKREKKKIINRYVLIFLSILESELLIHFMHILRSLKTDHIKTL